MSFIVLCDACGALGFQIRTRAYCNVSNIMSYSDSTCVYWRYIND